MQHSNKCLWKAHLHNDRVHPFLLDLRHTHRRNRKQSRGTLLHSLTACLRSDADLYGRHRPFHLAANYHQEAREEEGICIRLFVVESNHVALIVTGAPTYAMSVLSLLQLWNWNRSTGELKYFDRCGLGWRSSQVERNYIQFD